MRDFKNCCVILATKKDMELNYVPWEAIGVYLKDSSDQESRKTVSKWLKESPENVSLFNEICHVQRITGKRIDFYSPSKEELWNELMRRISPVENRKKTVKFYWLKYAAVAASLILAFFMGNLIPLGKNDKKEPVSGTVTYAEVIAPPGNRMQLVLPDSTRVWLNSGARLRYPSSFNGKERDVFMTGECYFEVTKNKHVPFVVYTPDIHVKVYGTHFNVSEGSGKKAVVTLLEGKVEVLNTENKSLSFLDPGQQLSVSPGDGKIQLKNAGDTNALIAWTRDMLVFKDEPFERVINYLENWYGVNIRLDPSLQNRHNYTFRVKTESLREVLDLISVITPVNYKIDGDQVLISRKEK